MSAGQKSTYKELPANLSRPQPPQCPPLCPLIVNHISPPHPPPDNLQNVLQRPAGAPNYKHLRQLHNANPPLTRYHSSTSCNAATSKETYSRAQDRNPPRHALASCFPSDTLHPINKVSPLIFRTLICAAPEAALIQTECDNFND